MSSADSNTKNFVAKGDTIGLYIGLGVSTDWSTKVAVRIIYNDKLSSTTTLNGDQLEREASLSSFRIRTSFENTGKIELKTTVTLFDSGNHRTYEDQVTFKLLVR